VKHLRVGLLQGLAVRKYSDDFLRAGLTGALHIKKVLNCKHWDKLAAETQKVTTMPVVRLGILFR
jgi:hypothetical protein